MYINNQVPPDLQGVANQMMQNVLNQQMNMRNCDNVMASFIWNEWTVNGNGVLAEALQKYPNGTLQQQQLLNILNNFFMAARNKMYGNNNMYGNGMFGNNNMMMNNNAGYWNGNYCRPGFNQMPNNQYGHSQSFFSAAPTANNNGNGQSPYAAPQQAEMPKQQPQAQAQPQQNNTGVQNTMESQLAAACNIVHNDYTNPTTNSKIASSKIDYNGFDYTVRYLTNQFNEDVTLVEGVSNKGYTNALDAVLDLMKVLPTASPKKFFSMRYNKLFTCDIQHKDMVGIISGLKELIIDQTASNRITYIKDVAEFLDKKYHSHVVKTIEKIFIDEFNRRTTAGEAVSSDQINECDYRFEVKFFDEITECLSTTNNPVIDAFQKIPGFKDKIGMIARESIVELIQNIEVLDPTVKTDLKDILTVIGNVTVGDTPLSMLPDIEAEIAMADATKKESGEYKNRVELVKAMYDAIESVSVLKLNGCSVCFSTMPFLGTVENGFVKNAPICIGGDPDDDVSFFIQNTAMADLNKTTTLIIMPTQNSIITYTGVMTTDKWIRFSPAKVIK